MDRRKKGRRNKNSYKTNDQCMVKIQLYGFNSRIYVIDNQICEVGVTCTRNGFPIKPKPTYGYGYHNSVPDSPDRQGEQFFSLKGPACRISGRRK